MSSVIHPPRIKKSGKLHLYQNTMEFCVLNEKTLITIEIWNNVKDPWIWNMYADVVTAANGFVWMKKWEEGKNYHITKTFDEKGMLVGTYVDICSSIKKDTNNVYSFIDWYLDIWKEPRKDPIFLDENKLEKALAAGYLTVEEGNITKNVGAYVIEALRKGLLPDF